MQPMAGSISAQACAGVGTPRRPNELRATVSTAVVNLRLKWSSLAVGLTDGKTIRARHPHPLPTTEKSD